MKNFRFNCLKNNNTESVLVVPSDTIAFKISFCFFAITLPIEKIWA